MVLPGSPRAQPFVELAPAPANVTEHQIKIGTAALAAEIRLRNPKDAVQFFRLGGSLTRTSDNAHRPATWKRTAPPQDDTIPAGAQMVLELAADIPEVGVYEIFIDTYSKDDKGAEVAGRRIRVLVTREADALPAEFIVDPKPAAETWPWNDRSRAYTIALRNAATKPLAFGTPEIVSFTRKSGDAQVTLDRGRVQSIDSSHCNSPLSPGKTCPLQLNLTSGFGPGEYMIDVGIAGAGGGWSQRTQILRVRATALIAFVVIVIGAGVGWYVQAWRTRGRRAFAALIDISRLREALKRLIELQREDIKSILRAVTTDLDDIESRARSDNDVAADLERIRRWLRSLAIAVEILERFDQLPDEAKAPLRARRDDLITRVAKPVPNDADRAALENLTGALTNDLGAAPAFLMSLTAAVDLHNAVDDLIGKLQSTTTIDLAGLRTQRDAIAAAISTAKGALPANAPAETLLTRSTALATETERVTREATTAAQGVATAYVTAILDPKIDAETDGDRKARLQGLRAPLVATAAPSLDRLRELAAAMKRAVGAREAATAPSIALPGGLQGELPSSLLLPLSGTSLEKLLASQRRHEIVTNLVILILTGLAGVLALWVPNATWGSVGDIITALVAGVATRVVVGEAGSANQATGAVR
jgi:hypothetical protein